MRTGARQNGRRRNQKEKIMSTLVRSAIFAAAVLVGLSAVEARDYNHERNDRSPSQYDLNNPDDVKAFWEAQRRNGN
jgi:hypothetical protein